MFRPLLRSTVVALCAALFVGLAPAPTQAAGTPRVYAVARAGQDWPGGKLLVKWRAVSAATYQMRWADAPSKLVHSRPVSTSRASGTYTGTLDRAKTWHVQVRAVRNGRAGAWSKVKGLKFHQGWPAQPVARAAAAGPGEVKLAWGYTPFSSRYRVILNAAWYGNWPGGPRYAGSAAGGWVSAGTRSMTHRVPTSPRAGDQLLAVDYANPVFARLEANNQYRSGANRLSAWVPVFPKPPAPQAGDPVRFGSYNLERFPSSGPRITAIAHNISSHGVEVVALQEANAATATALVRALGPTWARSTRADRSGQQILFRNDRFAQLDAGAFGVRNSARPGEQLSTPWVQLRHRQSSQSGQRRFYVVSAHFAAAPGGRVEENRQTGLAARDLDAAVERINPGNLPVILGGDLRYGREPFNEAPATLPAQPTLVRAGYYDAMAAVSRVGSQYSTVNVESGAKRARQTAHPAGVAARSDHILVKGFRGAARYQHVHSWSYRGLVPSDHNLIFADLKIPFAS